MLGVHRGDADRDAVGDRAGDGAAQVELVIIAVGGREVGAERVARPAGDEGERAADRVLAVERALRPAQHLDPLQIEQVELGAADAAVIDAVDIDADRRIEGLQRVGLADAANVDVGRVGGAAALDDVEVRHRALQAGRVLRLDAVERALAERRDRGRDVLEILLGAPGGDGDHLAIGVDRRRLALGAAADRGRGGLLVGRRRAGLGVAAGGVVRGEGGGGEGGERDGGAGQLQQMDLGHG